MLKSDRSFSQIQVSQRIGIEQSYLSKIERGTATKLSEEKIIALAEVLGEDPDYMLALGGKISSDVLCIIQQRPRLFSRLVRQMKNMPEDVIEADHDFKQRQTRISHLYNLASIGFFHFEDDPERSAWSKLTPSILRLPEDAAPTMESIRRSLSPTSRDLFSTLEQGSTARLEPYECELQLKDAGGGPRFVRIWGDCERLPDTGSVVRLGLVHDVTADVLARNELKQAHLALSGTVECQTEQLDTGIQKLKKEIAARKLLETELREINEEIERQKDIQKEYLKQSAYELRSLINRLAVEKGERGESSLSVLGHISAVINNMIDFFQIKSGVSPVMNSIETQSFFRDLVSDIQNEAKAAQRNFNLELSPHLPPTIVVDCQRLQQIAHPVADYFIHTTPWGSISLTVDYSDQKGLLNITFSSTKSAEVVQKEFFYPTICCKGKATPSWMLLTVGPIIEGMGGQLFVDRTSSDGAVVTISLPSRAHEARKLEDTGKRRFLVVEDDEYSRLYAHRIIDKLGHEVESVALGQDALKKCLDTKYDTILLDIQLPDIDGVAIAKTIRGEGGPNSTTRIIAVTAHATPEDRRIFEQAGIDNFIAKPFKRDELAKVIQNIT